MINYAKVENNIVTDVIVLDDLYAVESEGQDFITNECGLEGTWLKSSDERRNPAAIGMVYDSLLDAFYAPSPFPSWVFNESALTWSAPVEYPSENPMSHTWDEATTSWIEVA